MGKVNIKSIVYTEHPEYVREYLITCCAFGDGDVVPVCLFAAIKPPDDLDNALIPKHIRQLVRQIVNEMPMHMRAPDAYGTTPAVGDLFWECAPNPQETEDRKVIAWLSDSEYLELLRLRGSSVTSFLEEEAFPPTPDVPTTLNDGGDDAGA